MTGSLIVVGLGPAGAELTTPAVQQAIANATDLIGYEPYLARVPVGDNTQRRHASDNRVEMDRARHALSLAAQGKRVVVVSSGDPGVFAMATAVFEAIDAGDPAWRDLDVRVEPGVTAMLAASAFAGAPLGGDFCAISMSDNMKSWATIEKRLEGAAHADFVISFYNPASRARPDLLGRAFDVLRRHKSPDTPVLFIRAAGTAGAELRIEALGTADHTLADMRTIVMVGSSRTKAIAREGRLPWIYTPRSEHEAR